MGFLPDDSLETSVSQQKRFKFLALALTYSHMFHKVLLLLIIARSIRMLPIATALLTLHFKRPYESEQL